MKQVTFAVGLLVLGLALGLVMPGVFAQAPQAEVQKWEQFCERHRPDQGPRDDMMAERANPSAAAQGQNGYQLVSAATNRRDSLILCYRRPAR